ncbi:MAG: T9SS type A sorting domain-containing protein [Bacteroidales bacterium]|jgi:hypothetical protein
MKKVIVMKVMLMFAMCMITVMSWGQWSNNIFPGPVGYVNGIIKQDSVIFTSVQDQGIYKYDTSWTQILGPANFLITHNLIIYSGNPAGLTYSIDSGKFWNQVSIGSYGIHSAAVINDSIVYCGEYGYVYLVNINDSVKIPSIGLPTSTIRSLCIKNDSVFAGTDVGVYATILDSNKWNVIGLSSYSTNALISFRDTMYAGTDSGIYIYNGSGSWNPTKIHQSILSFGKDNSMLFAGTNSDTIFTYNGSWNIAQHLNNSAASINSLLITNDSIYAGGSTMSYNSAFIFTIAHPIDTLNNDTLIPSDSVSIHPIPHATKYYWTLTSTAKDTTINDTTDVPYDSNLDSYFKSGSIVKVNGHNTWGNSSIIKIKYSATGIHSFTTHQFFNLYPNPTTDKLFVETQSPKSIYYIYNVAGELIEQNSIEGKAQVDVQGYAPGVYVLKLNNSAEKFVVNR